MSASPIIDPRHKYASGFPPQTQEPPGHLAQMDPPPDHGEDTYQGHGRLAGRRALITGGDSGIGRAVAIAFAREGADIAIVHLPAEVADANDTLRLVHDAGRRGIALAGDLCDEEFSEQIVAETVTQLGGLDVLVLNAGYQRDIEDIGSASTEDVDRIFRTNLYSLIFTTRAARPHLKAGASIIVTASIQAARPSPVLAHYAMTKAAQVAFVKALAEDLGPDGIRVNAVAPGPIWTPLIPATGWSAQRVATFGTDTPLGRAGQPAELAGAYVYLASDDASYVSGAIVPVTGGKTL